MLCYETIFLSPDLDKTGRQQAIAHCLGHYFLHDGNQIWFSRHGNLSRSKQEGQANEFAAWLLFPELMERCPERVMDRANWGLLKGRM